jgi:hypothetical protein
MTVTASTKATGVLLLALAAAFVLRAWPAQPAPPVSTAELAFARGMRDSTLPHAHTTFDPLHHLMYGPALKKYAAVHDLLRMATTANAAADAVPTASSATGPDSDAPRGATTWAPSTTNWLKHLFATPLWRGSTGAGELPLLRRCVRQLRSVSAATGAVKSNVGGWHSRTDLLDEGGSGSRLDAACRAALERLRGVVVGAASGFGRALERRAHPVSAVLVESWANVNERRGDYNSAHTHGTAMVSGVLYLDDGGAPQACTLLQDPRGDASWVLLGRRPSSGSSATTDDAAARQLPPLNSEWGGDVCLPPVPGQLWLFPGWLRHAVLPYQPPSAGVRRQQQQQRTEEEDGASGAPMPSASSSSSSSSLASDDEGEGEGDGDGEGASSPRISISFNLELSPSSWPPPPPPPPPPPWNSSSASSSNPSAPTEEVAAEKAKEAHGGTGDGGGNVDAFGTNETHERRGRNLATALAEEAGPPPSHQLRRRAPASTELLWGWPMPVARWELAPSDDDQPPQLQQLLPPQLADVHHLARLLSPGASGGSGGGGGHSQFIGGAARAAGTAETAGQPPSLPATRNRAAVVAAVEWLQRVLLPGLGRAYLESVVAGHEGRHERLQEEEEEGAKEQGGGNEPPPGGVHDRARWRWRVEQLQLLPWGPRGGASDSSLVPPPLDGLGPEDGFIMGGGGEAPPGQQHHEPGWHEETSRAGGHEHHDGGGGGGVTVTGVEVCGLWRLISDDPRGRRHRTRAPLRLLLHDARPGGSGGQGQQQQPQRQGGSQGGGREEELAAMGLTHGATGDGAIGAARALEAGVALAFPCSLRWSVVAGAKDGGQRPEELTSTEMLLHWRMRAAAGG